ncbi:hypothetical protein KAM448_36620 [Aeromonas caviae]|uniref:Uncharacterized protein n=1 Tax=Aeromonas caviae TaxID=648 RepID=A0ABD0BC40_AERCA|nr:hypothetical protein KAM376_38570 [Aeromonas caviae]GJA82607.1 hypothetical protein KAM355_31670 [Aeromonas caviae]GJB00416.1 hypothetical protein KAM359_38230 [Aeromonas caviae]GJB12666.1 hypothetical protein KAM362_32260 [Aeromonas caviae]GJB25266.1 hypothetical protein KAM365_30160 [Aeromonas caviae]
MSGMNKYILSFNNNPVKVRSTRNDTPMATGQYNFHFPLNIYALIAITKIGSMIIK